MERSFSRQLSALTEVFDYVDQFTMSAGIEPSDAFPFRLAIEEVFVNMVKHNPEGAGEIGIALVCDGDALLVTLRDSDTGAYDITKHRADSLEAPLHNREPGGLGIHLVNHLMDEVNYTHENREARITLIKRYPQKHASDRHE